MAFERMWTLMTTCRWQSPWLAISCSVHFGSGKRVAFPLCRSVRFCVFRSKQHRFDGCHSQPFRVDGHWHGSNIR